MTKKAQDVLNDNSHAMLYKIAQTMDFKLPKYVEEGIPLEKEAADATEDTLFADTKNRRFPITDRANTWLSSAYFAKTASNNYTKSEYTTITKRLLKAAELYGISKDVQNVISKITSEKVAEARAFAEKEAEAAKSCYGEPETNGFPMFNKEQVKKACDYFNENAYAYDWRRRANIAKNIMRKTAEYGITPPELIRKEAGVGFPRIDYLAENLLTRESELVRRGLNKMAGDMRRTIKIICDADPSELMDQLEPLREMISGSDELSGIDHEYGRRFNPPADFLFDIDDAEASDFKDDTVPMGGELMSAKALSGLPRHIFESVMSPSMVDSLFENGKMSPKKISITIVKMAPRDQTSLLDCIRDFTSNAEDDYRPEDMDEVDEPNESDGCSGADVDGDDDNDECFSKECGSKCKSCRKDK